MEEEDDGNEKGSFQNDRKGRSKPFQPRFSMFRRIQNRSIQQMRTGGRLSKESQADGMWIIDQPALKLYQ
jgi:hypothetical protein